MPVKRELTIYGTARPRTKFSIEIVKSIKLLPGNIKSMNPIQKYPRIIELSACILNILFSSYDFKKNDDIILSYFK